MEIFSVIVAVIAVVAIVLTVKTVLVLKSIKSSDSDTDDPERLFDDLYKKVVNFDPMKTFENMQDSADAIEGLNSLINILRKDFTCVDIFAQNSHEYFNTHFMGELVDLSIGEQWYRYLAKNFHSLNGNLLMNLIKLPARMELELKGNPNADELAQKASDEIDKFLDRIRYLLKF